MIFLSSQPSVGGRRGRFTAAGTHSPWVGTGGGGGGSMSALLHTAFMSLHCRGGAGVGYEQGTGATQSRGPDGKQSEGYAGGTDGNRRGSAIGDSPS